MLSSFGKLTRICMLGSLCYLYSKFPRKFIASTIHRIIRDSDITVIKFVQWISMRPDIINKDLYDLFSTYKDSYPAHDLSHTRELIRNIYGQEIEDMFVSFDTVPIASASIAQVYRARLDGVDVAVKVKHPYVDSNIKDYKRLIRLIFNILRKFFGIRINVDIDLFYKSIADQVDLMMEGENAERFYGYFKDTEIIIPQVVKKHRDVIIYTYEESKKFDQYCEGRSREEQSQSFLKFMSSIYYSIFCHNIFHADIHDANWGVNEDGRVVLYDFGFVKEVQGNMIRQVLKAICSEDAHTMMYVLLNCQDEEFDANLRRVKNYKISDLKSLTDYQSNSRSIRSMMNLFYDIHVKTDSAILSYIVVGGILDFHCKQYEIDNNEGKFDGTKLFTKLIEGTEAISADDSLIESYENLIDYVQKFQYIRDKVHHLYAKMIEIGYDLRDEMKDIWLSLINIVLIYDRLKETDIIDMLNYVEKHISSDDYVIRVNRTKKLFDKYNDSIYFLLKLQRYLMNKTEGYEITDSIVDGYVETDMLKNLDEMICLFDEDDD